MGLQVRTMYVRTYVHPEKWGPLIAHVAVVEKGVVP